MLLGVAVLEVIAKSTRLTVPGQESMGFPPLSGAYIKAVGSVQTGFQIGFESIGVSWIDVHFEFSFLFHPFGKGSVVARLT
jgi:hypothetical protein